MDEKTKKEPFETLFNAAELGVGEYRCGRPGDDAWAAKVQQEIEQVKALVACDAAVRARLQALRHTLTEYDTALNAIERVPTTNDYNEVLATALHGVAIALLLMGEGDTP